MLIQENYATFTTIDDLTLHQQKVITDKKIMSQEERTTDLLHSDVTARKSFFGVTDQANSTARVSGLLSNYVLDGQQRENTSSHTPEAIAKYNNIARQKEKEQKRILEFAKNDCRELIQLLDDDNVSPATPLAVGHGESSGTSDFSDMEVTPVPKMVSLKNRQTCNASKMLHNALGQESFDLLTKGFGLPYDEDEDTVTSKSGKRVTFSPHDQVLDCNPDSSYLETPKSRKPFDFVDSTKGESSSHAGHQSKLEEESAIFQRLSIDATQFHRKFKHANDDVLVYGKLKRHPFQLSDLDLPLPLEKTLSQLSFKTPTPFQQHFWPAVAAFRHVVGIPELSCNPVFKVLAYFLPILRNMIGNEEIYKAAGKGNGVSFIFLLF